MLTKTIWIGMFAFALSACGQSHPSSSSQKDAVTPPVTTTESIPQTNDAPSDIDSADAAAISKLRPTTYYLAQEKNVDCKGKYGGINYNGTERSDIIEVDGSVIANVCTRFYKTLLMEGSAILQDRGHGEISINYGGVIGGTKRFHHLDRCVYGEGIRRDLCLLPYHTLAADNKVHKVDDIIFIPKAVGLELPDGTKHEGYFIVRDTGGAFTGAGGSRVDMFTGTDPDNRNVFLAAGFQKSNPMPAYKITGSSAEVVKQKLKDRFGDLY